MTLTDRRVTILVAVAHHGRGYAPSWREIGAMTGLVSTSSVGYQVRALIRAGLLRPGMPNCPRTVALADGVAVSRTGVVARAVRVTRCPACSLDLPEDHTCRAPSLHEENAHA
jgi:hypothetical protein